ncbi:uncharacterized protein LOC113344911 [Papaver somniferum]|uniref:uncharacterized protein LOC113344911 n=1 Tax=Papaver somniferum TaxID=3469 RepID=UPI000E6F5277|nr:uncharacterized protein LOC113344911 [Papaver somniferum]
MELSMKETVKAIAKSSLRNFLFITFILILPLSLFQMLFEYNLLELVILVSNLSDISVISSPEYPYSKSLPSQPSHKQDVCTYFFYNFVYLVFFLTFYLLSTSAMIFTMASHYVSKPVSCVSTLFAIPRISKHLFITFLDALPLMIGAYIANFALLYLINAIPKDVVAFIFAIIYGLFVTVVNAYIMAIWNLANVISFLEPNVHAVSALKMSKLLLRRKTVIAILFAAHYLLAVSVIQFTEGLAMVMDYDNYIVVRILLIVCCVIIMTGINFVWLTGQSVLYYVCRRYHNDVIDIKALYDHLDGKKSGNGNSIGGDNMEV